MMPLNQIHIQGWASHEAISCPTGQVEALISWLPGNWLGYEATADDPLIYQSAFDTWV